VPASGGYRQGIELGSEFHSLADLAKVTRRLAALNNAPYGIVELSLGKSQMDWPCIVHLGPFAGNGMQEVPPLPRVPYQ
jgi:hypothetical protein